MTLITFQDGKPVFRDGKVGTEQECCCGCPSCISLDLFKFNEYSDASFDVQARYDEVKPFFDALQENLEAAGWTTARTDRLFFGDAEENAGVGPGNSHGLDIKITATCECCIEDISQCQLELLDEPEGLWVQVIPDVEDLAGAGPLFFAPQCLVGQDCFVPARVNGVGFDNVNNEGWWVPVCDPNAEHCNPLP